VRGAMAVGVEAGRVDASPGIAEAAGALDTDENASDGD
jgi:hypothetical protein